MDLFEKACIDLALAERVARGEMTEAERQKEVARMVKYAAAEKGEGRERADWVKNLYPFVLKEAELVPAKFYKDAAALQAEYGDPDENGAYLDEENKKHYPDWPEDKQQWSLKFECRDEDYEGRWVWAFASPRFGIKKDGSWFGKLAAVIGAIDKAELPSGSTGPFAITDPHGLDDLFGRPLNIMVDPKPDNPQYGKATDYAPMKPAEAKKYAAPAPADPDVSGEAIPF